MSDELQECLDDIREQLKAWSPETRKVVSGLCEGLINNPAMLDPATFEMILQCIEDVADGSV